MAKKNATAEALSLRPTLAEVQATYSELGRALELYRTTPGGLGVHDFAKQEAERLSAKLAQEIGGLL